MVYHGTAVSFTELVAFIRRVDRKIESLQKDLNAEDSSRTIQEIEDLKSVQKDLEVRLNKIINMFYHLMASSNDNRLDVYAVSQECLTVVRATVQWFTQKQQEMEARADHLVDLKAVASRKPASPPRKARGKDAGIKLEAIKEDIAADFPGGKGKEIEVGNAGPGTRGSDKPNPRSPVLTPKEASKGKISTSVSEIEEVPETSDEDPKIHRATVPVGNLFVPQKRLAHRLNLTEVSDNDWKPVECILAESSELSVELALLLVELYIQLLPRDKKEGMSMVLYFVAYLNELAAENNDRDVVKWIRHVLKVADEELGHLVITAGQLGKSRAEEVQDLLDKFIAVISDLEDLNDFSRLPESVSSVNGAVESLKEELKDIKKDTKDIKKHMEERRIKLKYGIFAPLIICLVNHIGMCFKHWFYRGKLR